MKMNWKVLKKPGFIIGAIVLFFIVLFFVNRSGGGSSASTTTNATGPSEALQAAALQAGTQTQLAQIAAGVQMAAIQADYAKSQDANTTGLAVAQLQAQVSTNQLAAEKAISEQTIAAQVHGMDLQYQTQVANNGFALDYAKQAYDYSLATTAMNVNLQENLAQQQTKAYEFSGFQSLIAQFGNPARREALIPQLMQFAGNGNTTSSVTVSA